MKHQVVGYIRVSSQGQNTARQLAGLTLDREFVDIMSGSIKNRENLLACIDYVREGDTLIVESIDRLARNLRDLQEIIHTLVQKGVSVKFVKENLKFTGNQDPMANLMLHMMGAFAEFERSIIRSRQKDGIEAAKKSGKQLGRPSKLTEKITEEIRNLKEKGTSIRQIAFKLHLSRPTVHKILRVNINSSCA